MTCWTGSETERVSTQAGRRFFRRSSCDWTEPACVRPGGVETPAPHAGRTDGEERLVFYTASPDCWCCTDPESRRGGGVPPHASGGGPRTRQARLGSGGGDRAALGGPRERCP